MWSTSPGGAAAGQAAAPGRPAPTASRALLEDIQLTHDLIHQFHELKRSGGSRAEREALRQRVRDLKQSQEALLQATQSSMRTPGSVDSPPVDVSVAAGPLAGLRHSARCAHPSRQVAALTVFTADPRQPHTPRENADAALSRPMNASPSVSTPPSALRPPDGVAPGRAPPSSSSLPHAHALSSRQTHRLRREQPPVDLDSVSLPAQSGAVLPVSSRWQDAAAVATPPRLFTEVQDSTASDPRALHADDHDRGNYNDYTFLTRGRERPVQLPVPSAVARRHAGEVDSAPCSSSSTPFAQDALALATMPRASSSAAAATAVWEAERLRRWKSVVFAVTLAESHTRRELQHTWEHRWAMKYAAFREERVRIALTREPEPPTVLPRVCAPASVVPPVPPLAESAVKPLAPASSAPCDEDTAAAPQLVAAAAQQRVVQRAREDLLLSEITERSAVESAAAFAFAGATCSCRDELVQLLQQEEDKQQQQQQREDEQHLLSLAEASGRDAIALQEEAEVLHQRQCMEASVETAREEAERRLEQQTRAVQYELRRATLISDEATARNTLVSDLTAAWKKHVEAARDDAARAQRAAAERGREEQRQVEVAAAAAAAAREEAEKTRRLQEAQELQEHLAAAKKAAEEHEREEQRQVEAAAAAAREEAEKTRRLQEAQELQEHLAAAQKAAEEREREQQREQELACEQQAAAAEARAAGVQLACERLSRDLVDAAIRTASAALEAERQCISAEDAQRTALRTAEADGRERVDALAAASIDDVIERLERQREEAAERAAREQAAQRYALCGEEEDARAVLCKEELSGRHSLHALADEDREGRQRGREDAQAQEDADALRRRVLQFAEGELSASVTQAAAEKVAADAALAHAYAQAQATLIQAAAAVREAVEADASAAYGTLQREFAESLHELQCAAAAAAAAAQTARQCDALVHESQEEHDAVESAEADARTALQSKFLRESSELKEKQAAAQAAAAAAADEQKRAEERAEEGRQQQRQREAEENAERVRQAALEEEEAQQLAEEAAKHAQALRLSTQTAAARLAGRVVEECIREAAAVTVSAAPAEPVSAVQSTAPVVDSASVVEGDGENAVRTTMAKPAQALSSSSAPSSAASLHSAGASREDTERDAEAKDELTEGLGTASLASEPPQPPHPEELLRASDVFVEEFIAAAAAERCTEQQGVSTSSASDVGVVQQERELEPQEPQQSPTHDPAALVNRSDSAAVGEAPSSATPSSAELDKMERPSASGSAAELPAQAESMRDNTDTSSSSSSSSSAAAITAPSAAAVLRDEEESATPPCTTAPATKTAPPPLSVQTSPCGPVVALSAGASSGPHSPMIPSASLRSGSLSASPSRTESPDADASDAHPQPLEEKGNADTQQQQQQQQSPESPPLLERGASLWRSDFDPAAEADEEGGTCTAAAAPRQASGELMNQTSPELLLRLADSLLRDSLHDAARALRQRTRDPSIPLCAAPGLLDNKYLLARVAASCVSAYFTQRAGLALPNTADAVGELTARAVEAALKKGAVAALHDANTAAYEHRLAQLKQRSAAAHAKDRDATPSPPPPPPPQSLPQDWQLACEALGVRLAADYMSCMTGAVLSARAFVLALGDDTLRSDADMDSAALARACGSPAELFSEAALHPEDINFLFLFYAEMARTRTRGSGGLGGSESNPGSSSSSNSSSSSAVAPNGVERGSLASAIVGTGSSPAGGSVDGRFTQLVFRENLFCRSEKQPGSPLTSQGSSATLPSPTSWGTTVSAPSSSSHSIWSPRSVSPLVSPGSASLRSRRRLHGADAGRVLLSMDVRRVGVGQLVLEHCLDNVLRDLVGDTVSWMGTLLQ